MASATNKSGAGPEPRAPCSVVKLRTPVHKLAETHHLTFVAPRSRRAIHICNCLKRLDGELLVQPRAFVRTPDIFPGLKRPQPASLALRPSCFALDEKNPPRGVGQGGLEVWGVAPMWAAPPRLTLAGSCDSGLTPIGAGPKPRARFTLISAVGQHAAFHL
jgi:hypothetical protein